MAGYIKNFLDEDYVNYAVYRTYQRLPHVLDSLGQTQRKILYVMEKLPETKKVKTAEVYSFVYGQTQYLHGDASVFTVVENLARSCSNNINLLTEEGSFGYRTNKAAASPRYTSTRFSKAARYIFNSIDKNIMFSQEFEGKPIEPQFLLPILPVSLVNGYSAIAVGFASKFLSRDPNIIIDRMIKALTYRKRKNSNWDKYEIEDIPPSSPFYTGAVRHDPNHIDPSAWVQTGTIKRASTRNIIEIKDLPPEGNRESYIKKLKRFQEKGIIKSYTEGCAKNTFKFQVKVTPDLWKKTDDEIMEILGLVERTVENFTFLNPDGAADQTILKFNTSAEYLKHFIGLRQNFYQVRKDYQLDNLQQEILVLKERIRFINMVNSGDIIITKRKKVDLEKELKDKDFIEIDSSMDHLLGMKMYALTEENILKYEQGIKVKEKERDMLNQTSTEDMHINELNILKKGIQSESKIKGFL